jgi:indole-3-glycerol phosphate synthase
VAALRSPAVAVIAELKRRSPSKGVINDALDAPARAREYSAGGAAALSVLTEPDRFGGSMDDLRAVRASVALPVLRKDFIVHPAQVTEASAAGAAAVLLIGRALDPAELAELAAAASECGLDVLYEARNAAEVERALRIPECAIGVNTRDLETLDVDAAVGERLLPLVPRDRVAVYESGIVSRADVERAARAGADAVLVGSALSAHASGAEAVAALAGVLRSGRA